MSHAVRERRMSARRKLRDRVHRIFDSVWQAGLMERRVAYREIAMMLGRSTGLAHLGALTPSQLQRVQGWACNQLKNAGLPTKAPFCAEPVPALAMRREDSNG